MQVATSQLTGAKSTVRGSLNQILQSSDAEQTYCLLIPGTDISLFKVNLPEKNQRKFIESIGFTLEDQLAEDINATHFTTFIKKENNTAAISCINKERLASWLSCNSNSRQLITSALPIVSVLPTHNDDITVVVTDTLTHVKTSTTMGYSIENDLAITLLLNNEANNSPAFHCYNVTTNEAFYAQLCDELNNSGATLENHGKFHSILDLELIESSHYIHGNILHGAYATKSRSPITNYWKIAAIFIALFLCIETSYVLIHKSRLETQIASANKAIETIFKKSFPNIKRVIDPKVQVTNGIRQLQDKGTQNNSTFIRLLTHSASALRKTPGITVSGYRYKNNQLTYDVTANSIESVSNAQKVLSKNKDIKAKLINARTKNKRVTGQVEVELIS